MSSIPHGGRLVNRVLEGGERQRWLARIKRDRFPVEFTKPEVADVLRAAHRSPQERGKE